ncbi:MAG: type II toxin-antitoxin system death-on-curing family toxin [Chloroflexota bacterium]|nr:type II toxin-antitoxin system death-on-curing family toxin [Chloroflexota bacterium]
MPSNFADPRKIEYLTPSELYNFNDQVTDGHTFVRDVNLLHSAAARPSIVLFGEPQFPTLIDKAGALLHSLAYHHLFADGNKRTAVLAVSEFLRRNGARLTWDDATQRAFVLEVARGGLDADQVAAQLAGYMRLLDADS